MGALVAGAAFGEGGFGDGGLGGEEVVHGSFFAGPAREGCGSLIQAQRLLLGRWVRAEAAAVFAALLDLGFLSTREAAEAALALVTSLFRLLAIFDPAN